MRRVNWIVAPTGLGDGQIGAALGFGFPEITVAFPEKHRVYTQDLIIKEIQTNWTPVKAIGSASVYKKIR